MNVSQLIGNYVLLSASTGIKWWGWILIALAGIVAFSFIMSRINAKFRENWDLNLFGGGLLMIIAGGCVAGGAILAKSPSPMLGWALCAIAAAVIILTLVYNCKKCGFGMGLVALLCQILFAPGSLILLVNYFQGTGYYAGSSSPRRRKRKEYYDDDRYDEGGRF